MLLAGATDPPPAVKISDRRTREGKGRWENTARSGSFLRGVSCDLANMEQQQQVIRNLYNTVRDFYMKKEEAKTEIKELFEDCKARNAVPVIYYTGHGEVGTGNWCFSDGTVTIQVGLFYHLFKASALWADAFSKSICPYVCPLFEVPFNGLFAPTSRSRMSNIFRDLQSLGKSNGKKWCHI